MQINIRIYNATGGTITLVKSIAWEGFYAPSPQQRIKNGELGVFTIVNSGLAAGAVVYRFQNGAGAACDCLIAFENPTMGQNRVVTVIREQGYFHYNLDIVRSSLMSKAGPFCEDASKTGCISITTITRENYATLAATIGVRSTKSLNAVVWGNSDQE